MNKELNNILDWSWYKFTSVGLNKAYQKLVFYKLEDTFFDDEEISFIYCLN